MSDVKQKARAGRLGQHLWYLLLLVVILAKLSTSEISYGETQQIPAAEGRAQAALSRVTDAFSSGPVRGRFLERPAGNYSFSPEDRLFAVLAVANPGRIGALATGHLLSVTGSVDALTQGLTVQNYQLANVLGGPNSVFNSPGQLVGGPNSVIHNPGQIFGGTNSVFNNAVKTWGGGISTFDKTGAVLGGTNSTLGQILAANPARVSTAVTDGARTAVQSSLEEATDAANAIESRLSRAIQPGIIGTLGADDLTGKPTREDVLTMAAAHAKAVSARDWSTEQNIARKWASIRQDVTNSLSDGTEFKSMYEYLENYPPWRYDWIARDAASVVAIADGDHVICSGVLIAQDLVLTAGHCFPKPPSSLQVWFNFATLSDGSTEPVVKRDIADEPVAPPKDRWPDLMSLRFSGSLYDYAIVRIVAPKGEQLLPPGATPQCLRRVAPDRADPLYVLGYPKGDRETVHESARVYLPFRVLEGNDLDLLRMDIAADLPVGVQRDQVMEEFDQSYVPEPQTMAQWRYSRFLDAREQGQPRMGIVADTFRGDSGAPIYDHARTQCVVGILNRGMDDTGERLTASWLVNEKVLPMAAILEDLSRNNATASLVDKGLDCPLADLRRSPLSDKLRQHFASGALCVVDKP